jgi:hypothetical protein
MELRPATAVTYLRHAFGQMLEVAKRLGEPLVNERPHGPTTNAVAALIVHCCGVTEYWLGHVGLGCPSDRDRNSEFTRTATLAELHALVHATLARAIDHLEGLEAGRGTEEGARPFPVDGDKSDAALVLHVLEELYQHLGHMELTADALLADPERRRPQAARSID